MTKNVLVSITGTQFSEVMNINEPLEVVTTGTYYKKNGKNYLFYEEMMEGLNAPVKNTVKFDSDNFYLTRSGPINTSMIFEKNRRSVSTYGTPFGSLSIGINAKEVDVKETKDEINVNVKYSLDANYEFVANCSIVLNIKSLGKNKNEE